MKVISREHVACIADIKTWQISEFNSFTCSPSVLILSDEICFSVLIWLLSPLQFPVISIFSPLDGFTNLTLIFLDFFLVERKRFCGTTFLLWGAFSLGVGRCLFPCSRMEINKLWAELMLLSNCCLSLSVSQSLLEAFFRQSLRKSISALFRRNSSHLD